MPGERGLYLAALLCKVIGRTDGKMVLRKIDYAGGVCSIFLIRKFFTYINSASSYNMMKLCLLYYATSKRAAGKIYPVSIQPYIGKTTENGVVSERVSINVGQTQACKL